MIDPYPVSATYAQQWNEGLLEAIADYYASFGLERHGRDRCWAIRLLRINRERRNAHRAELMAAFARQQKLAGLKR